MKKEEIKNAFEEELKNINVSRELKEKTLNKISYKNNVYHLPYWIKNCVAIFIVTCICLSIYLANNKIDFNKNIKEKNFNENIYQETNLKNTNKNDTNGTFMLKSANPSLEYSPVENSIDDSTRLRKNSNVMMDYINIENSYILTEEDFLINNPNAIKTDNGYLITEDDETFLFVFENGFFLRKDIIK